LFIFVDSTEISKNETVLAMKKAQKLLLASVTHEFWNPLNSIKGNIDLLIWEFKQKQYPTMKFEIVNKNVDLMLSLVEDILDISKLENGAFKIWNEQFSIW